MPVELEMQLRQQLNAEVSGIHLTAGAIGVVTSRGRGRIRRRRAVAAGVTTLIAALGIGVMATGQDDGKGTDPVDVVATTTQFQSPTAGAALPPPQMITRAAEEGDLGAYAHLTGTLVVTEADCIAVTTADGQLLGVVWGNGWSASRQDGTAAVYDAEGNLFAREGDQIGLGGATSPSRYGDNPCATEIMWEANDVQVARPVG